MADNTIFVGAGAGIVGLLVGYLAGGPNTEDLVEQVTSQVNSSAESAASAGAEQMKAMEGKLTANAQQVAALDEKIAGLEKALTTATASQAEATSAIDGKLDDAVLFLTKQMEGLSSAGTEQTAKLESALKAGIGQLEGSLGQAVAALPAATAPAQTEDVAAAAPTVEEVKIEGVKVGQTEVLMDGAVRVFISGVDQDANIARVAVNGLKTEMLGGYHDVTFMIDEKACSLLLDGIVEGHVQLSAECGE